LGYCLPEDRSERGFEVPLHYPSESLSKSYQALVISLSVFVRRRITENDVIYEKHILN